MSAQVFSSSGSMENPDNHPIDHRRLLRARRASLIQQAKGLVEQRRAILGELGEIDKALTETVRIGEADSIAFSVPKL